MILGLFNISVNVIYFSGNTFIMLKKTLMWKLKFNFTHLFVTNYSANVLSSSPSLLVLSSDLLASVKCFSISYRAWIDVLVVVDKEIVIYIFVCRCNLMILPSSCGFKLEDVSTFELIDYRL